VPILPSSALPGQDIHAVYPSRRLVSARVGALVDFLAEAFKPTNWYEQLSVPAGG
jgi:DNA-binding transcriptional LysR family regulator